MPAIKLYLDEDVHHLIQLAGKQAHSKLDGDAEEMLK